MMSIGVMSAARTNNLLHALVGKRIRRQTEKDSLHTLSLLCGWPSQLLSLLALHDGLSKLLKAMSYLRPVLMMANPPLLIVF